MKIKIADYGHINEPQIYKKISDMMLQQYNVGLNKKMLHYLVLITLVWMIQKMIIQCVAKV